MSQATSHTKPHAERLFALVLVAVAAYTFFYARGLRLYTPSGPGAGLFPLLISVALGLGSVLWLFQLWRVPEGNASAVPGVSAATRVALQTLVVVAFVLLLKPLGYAPSAFLLVVGTALIAGERNWIWLTIVAGIASFGIKFLFHLLGTSL